jgi:chemotaxis protein CheD
MKFSEMELPVIYLRSGELYFTDRSSVVVTVLGSCVSITMFHRRLKLSAVSHGLLPHCRSKGMCESNCNDAAKYVECSLPVMLVWFKQHGAPLYELEVGIFGGAEMFGTGYAGRSSFSVGRQNVDIAEKVLKSEGVKVLSRDVGGKQGRKIYFNTHSGDISLQQLQSTVVLANSAGEVKQNKNW